jgi:hypothetical protein
MQAHKNKRLDKFQIIKNSSESKTNFKNMHLTLV